MSMETSGHTRVLKMGYYELFALNLIVRKLFSKSDRQLFTLKFIALSK